MGRYQVKMSINPMQRVCCCMPQLVDREEGYKVKCCMVKVED